MTTFKKSRGFTLVELAIVITIIGLLIGGVLKGQEMIENAKITSTISQIRSYEAAFVSFKTIYNGLPGDLLQATQRIQGCNATSYCSNGNGDGLVGTVSSNWYSDANSTESLNFWKHLQLAGLITGVNSLWDPAGTKAFGTSQPIAKFDDQLGFHAKGNRDVPKNHSMLAERVNGTMLLLSIRPSGLWDEDVDSVPPRIAAVLDQKMDDGQASKGKVFGVSSGWGTGCGVPNLGQQLATGYAPKEKDRRCDMGFIIGR